MNELLLFSIEMLIVSALFFCGYFLLKKNTTPTSKRFYLLLWLGCSVLLPLITIEFENAPNSSVSSFIENKSSPVFPVDEFVEKEPLPSTIDNAKQVVIHAPNQPMTLDWEGIILSLYFLVSFFFIGRTLLGYAQINRLKLKSKKVTIDGSSCFEVQDDQFKGASFFNWIFIGKSVEKGRNTVVQHELAHSKLLHSADILTSHIYCAIFWFNPFAWILKREIAINNELEADAHLLNTTDTKDYAHLLIDLTTNGSYASIVNHFSAFHLKSRIKAIAHPSKHRKWVPFLLVTVLFLAFAIVSCSKIDDTSELARIERMNDVKSITTRFTSHQSDTQQKTGKIVAIATFNPDGSLDEFVEQTTYPYDFEFEKKKAFWDQPDSEMIPYIMDGLSLKTAEKSFLYGYDWPASYAKFVKERSINEGDFPWKEIVEVDNDQLPGLINRKKDREQFKETFIDWRMPDINEYFEYDNGKIKKVFVQNIYHELKYNDERRKKLAEIVKKNRTEEETDILEQMRLGSGEKNLSELYTYENDRLASLKTGEYEYKFSYENDLLTKSEYFKGGTLLNTRFHYYKRNLKDRTEIFNMLGELEYTIDYAYEFWDS